MPRKARVGILGSGDVGQTLGGSFAALGYDVLLGSRSPDSAKLKKWMKSAKGHAATGTFAEAAAHGDILVLATHGEATQAVLDRLGAHVFDGKLVLDATNPLTFHNHEPPGLFVGTTDSLGERVQRALPGARVVKCFNTVPNGLMVHPRFHDGPSRMLICGEDAGAKRRTDAILKEFGWAGALDVGGIEAARWLEALVPLWMRACMATGSWDLVLNVVT